MKLIIEIPKEFESHFNHDRFADSFWRISGDLDRIVYPFGKDAMSGNYEKELVDMLDKALVKAEVIAE
jgi:hypothetical protein